MEKINIYRISLKFFKLLQKKITKLFEPEEVEVTFTLNKHGDFQYTYKKVV